MSAADAYTAACEELRGQYESVAGPPTPEAMATALARAVSGPLALDAATRIADALRAVANQLPSNDQYPALDLARPFEAAAQRATQFAPYAARNVARERHKQIAGAIRTATTAFEAYELDLSDEAAAAPLAQASVELARRVIDEVVLETFTEHLKSELPAAGSPHVQAEAQRDLRTALHTLRRWVALHVIPHPVDARHVPTFTVTFTADEVAGLDSLLDDAALFADQRFDEIREADIYTPEDVLNFLVEEADQDAARRRLAHVWADARVARTPTPLPSTPTLQVTHDATTPGVADPSQITASAPEHGVGL